MSIAVVVHNACATVCHRHE